jgi:hypothetical protein
MKLQVTREKTRHACEWCDLGMFMCVRCMWRVYPMIFSGMFLKKLKKLKLADLERSKNDVFGLDELALFAWVLRDEERALCRRLFFAGLGELLLLVVTGGLAIDTILRGLAAELAAELDDDTGCCC